MTALQMYNQTDGHSTVFTATGSRFVGRAVKNLGWILKHWRDVEEFYILPDNSHHIMPSWDAFMIARLREQQFYTTAWASYEVAKDWLKRPVFSCFKSGGLPITVFSDWNREFLLL